MDTKPFFSIVMPVYGVEPYLRQAIDSIVNQTYQNFEVILVNDASYDNSAEICKEYSEKYENIKFVAHEKNMGLSAARNTGFSYVQGEYVWFMDSDDYVDSDLLEKVYNSLCENKAEIAVFGCVEEYYGKNGEINKSVVMCPQEAYCTNAEEVHKQILPLETGTFYGYAWNKFYQVQHIKDCQLTFENIVLIEDIKFNIKFCDDIGKMNILAITPYHYAKRGTNSLTAKFVPEYYEVHRERVQLIYQQQKKWGTDTENAKNTIANIYVRYIFSALARNCDKRAGMTHKDRKEWLKEVYNDSLFNELIDFSAPDSGIVKIMSRNLRKRAVFGTLLLGRGIYFVQTKLKGLFIKAKQRRQ